MNAKTISSRKDFHSKAGGSGESQMEMKTQNSTLPIKIEEGVRRPKEL